MPNDQALEDQIQAKGLTAPRISLAHVSDMVERVTYRFSTEAGTTTTFCHAFLDDSFYLTTGVSACVSPENFDYQIGHDVALKNAKAQATDKLYELEGYRLWVEVNND